MHSVFDRFSATAGEFGDRPFLHIPQISTSAYADRALDLTYAEALEEVVALRQLYGDAGYGSGHRVALVLENRADLFLHWFALNALGAGIVPLNRESLPGEIAQAIGLSAPQLLVVVPEAEADFAGAAGRAGIEIAKIGDGYRSPPVREPVSGSASGPDQECAMLFTSGSTGAPKGCVLSNAYFNLFGE